MTPDIETTTDRTAAQRSGAAAPADPSRRARPVKLSRDNVSLAVPKGPIERW